MNAAAGRLRELWPHPFEFSIPQALHSPSRARRGPVRVGPPTARMHDEVSAAASERCDIPCE